MRSILLRVGSVEEGVVFTSTSPAGALAGTVPGYVVGTQAVVARPQPLCHGLPLSTVKPLNSGH